MVWPADCWWTRISCKHKANWGQWTLLLSLQGKDIWHLGKPGSACPTVTLNLQPELGDLPASQGKASLPETAPQNIRTLSFGPKCCREKQDSRSVAHVADAHCRQWHTICVCATCVYLYMWRCSTTCAEASVCRVCTCVCQYISKRKVGV